MQPVRRDMQIVFQNPFASLNPRLRVHEILAEPLKLHGSYDGNRSEGVIDQLIEKVGLARDQRFRYRMSSPAASASGSASPGRSRCTPSW